MPAVLADRFPFSLCNLLLVEHHAGKVCSRVHLMTRMGLKQCTITVLLYQKRYIPFIKCSSPQNPYYRVVFFCVVLAFMVM